MYVPKHFAVTDQEQVLDFIRANSFGQLISSVADNPFVTHMPFLLSDDNSRLIGHFAKQNPQHLELDNQTVLVTLQGSHDYISPSWYLSSGVPTWNYQAAHIYGTAKVFTDQEKLKLLLDQLTENNEAGFESPWQPDYPASMLNAIVGVEILISDIQAKFKLNQNRSAADTESVATHLEEQGSHQLAKSMRELK
jgi:transcriptional regulator